MKLGVMRSLRNKYDIYVGRFSSGHLVEGYAVVNILGDTKEGMFEDGRLVLGQLINKSLGYFFFILLLFFDAFPNGPRIRIVRQVGSFRQYGLWNGEKSNPLKYRGPPTFFVNGTYIRRA